MLDRRNRLTSSASFTAVTRRGRRAGSRSLVVHLLRDAGTAVRTAGVVIGSDASDARGPLVGFVVSKAVGNAVVRNRVQRRLRHLTRARIPQLPGDARVVVRALPTAGGSSYGGLERDLDTALQRLGIATRTEEGR